MCRPAPVASCPVQWARVHDELRAASTGAASLPIVGRRRAEGPC
jgi:hypothetical protein